MSYSLFKQNMTSLMDNPDGIASFQQFGTVLTTEYDLLIRRGFQSQTDPVPVSVVNVPGMQSLVTVALQMMLQQTTGPQNIIFEIGKGIVMYWTGAMLANMPPPLTPAPGSIVNVTTTMAPILSPGTFPNLGPIQPTENTSDFLDTLIDAIDIHLTSINGLYNTISMYPGVPSPVPGPGVLPWVGFTIP